MKKLTFLLLITISSILNSQTIKLTYTGKYKAFHVPLDSILIKNLTQGCDTTLISPDTILNVSYAVSIADHYRSENSFKISQNFPNPFYDRTSINVHLPAADVIDVFVFNLIGQKIVYFTRYLKRGMHSFSFYSGKSGIFSFVVKYRSEIQSTKMISISDSDINNPSLNYDGIPDIQIGEKSSISGTGFILNYGDQLKYTGFAGHGKDSIVDSPAGNKNYEFEFIMGFPCPTEPSFTYGGQTYKTVQIGDQCWMAENINIGSMIDVNFNPQNDGIIEKYCYNNLPSKCAIYGGLYQWHEMMQYGTTVGDQGICPTGWHIPSDDEWKILEGAVDSQYGVGDPEWDLENSRGFDAGGNLKEVGIAHWNLPNTGATNKSGFGALPGGYRNQWMIEFGGIGTTAIFWTTSSLSFGLCDRSLINNMALISRYFNLSNFSESVRCLKN